MWTVGPFTPTPTSSPGPHKVMVILEENHGRADAEANMPYLVSLESQYGKATNYSAITHPSLPNYLAIFGGSTFGITGDCGVGEGNCTPGPPSVFGQAITVGKTARAYQESMTSNCDLNGSSSADAITPSSSYAPRHGPWVYWTNPDERSACEANDVSMGLPASGNLHDDIKSGNLPVVGEMTPNLCDDAHDCSLPIADSWLHQWIPQLMTGSDWTSGHLTIIVTFDEGSGSNPDNVLFAVINPRLSSVTVNGTGFNHYSLTKWLDDNAGLPELNNAVSAPDLKAAFGLL